MTALTIRADSLSMSGFSPRPLVGLLVCYCKVDFSARFKDNIQPMDQASKAIFDLKPVTFHYKKVIVSRGVALL